MLVPEGKTKDIGARTGKTGMAVVFGWQLGEYGPRLGGKGRICEMESDTGLEHTEAVAECR